MTDLSLPPFGRLAWVDVVLLGWFALTLASVAYVAFDAITKNPEMKVMRWGWVLVTLYLGPIGLVLYVLSCKEPSRSRSGQPVPSWLRGRSLQCSRSWRDPVLDLPGEPWARRP